MDYRHSLVPVSLISFGISIPAYAAEAAIASVATHEPHRSIGPTAGSSSPRGPLTGPLLGYSLRADRAEARPILGIPGAVLAGGPFPLGGPYRNVVVSSTRAYALGVRTADGGVVITNLQSSARSLLIGREVPGMRNVDHIVLSPTGTTAALYRSEKQSIAILGDLPRRPRLLSEISTRGFSTAVRRLAVSDDGGAVVVTASHSEGDAVFALSPLSAPRRLTSVRQTGGLAFGPDSQEVFVADSGRDQILRIKGITGSTAVSVLADIRQGVSSPLTVEVSGDRRQLIVLNRGSDRVLVLELSSGSTESLPCFCQPLAIFRMQEPNTFGVMGSSKETIAVVRTQPGSSAIFFVPLANPGRLHIPGGNISRRR